MTKKLKRHAEPLNRYCAGCMHVQPTKDGFWKISKNRLTKKWFCGKHVKMENAND